MELGRAKLFEAAGAGVGLNKGPHRQLFCVSATFVLFTAPPLAMPGPLNARYLPSKAPGASSPATPQKEPDASSPSPDPVPATPASEKNENRTKKRKRTEAQDGTSTEDVDVPKKHKSVLQKFERSTKVAERLKARAQPAEDNAPSEEPELHGKLSAYMHILH